MSFFHRLEYFATTALRGLWANPLTSLAAVATIAIALVPVGALWVAIGNMSTLLEEFGDELRVTAFLRADAELADGRRLAEQVAGVDGVASVEIVSREEALERFRRRLGNEELFGSFEENPLPVSLEIRLAAERRSQEGFRAVRDRLERFEQVESVAGGEAWLEGYARALGLVRSAAFGIGSVLGAAALLMVGITIRLAVYARRAELEILSLVGASRGFLRTPFLVEGILQGAGGGLLGLVLLSTVFSALVPRVRDGLALFLGWTEPAFLTPDQMVALVALGAGLGLVGAVVAVWNTRLA